jgi:glycosyltransferase involved in cell wall biosynthesis
LAEAACAGLPIVARQSGGQAEYVRHDENGYLLPFDAGGTDWTEAIHAILSSDAVRERFSAAGRRLGQRLCAQQRFDEQISKFLTRLAG